MWCLFTIVLRTTFFCFRKFRVILDRLKALYPLLVLDDIEHFIDGEPERIVVLFQFEGSEWIQ